MSYVKNNIPDQSCFFCPSERSDKERLILARNEKTLLMLNLYPYTCGHLMVAPLRHVSDLDALDDTELLELMHMLKKGRALLQKVAKPDGFNIGINVGKSAGAGVEEHLHIHIVPRWNGDSNFMTVVGDVRVIPEGLTEAFEQLSAALAEGL
jgi:ATP adenylyltransferase